MAAYPIVLVLHSWVRWLVVCTGAAAATRATIASRRDSPWTALDAYVQTLFIGALDFQVLLGLSLYAALSPLTPRSLEALRADMGVATLRFFAVEHAFAMLLALAFAHAGAVLARRAPSSAGRHKRAAIGASAALVAILVGIPWPLLPYARPLARLP